MPLSKDGRGVFKISDFVEVISKYYYVDKSLLIKELLDNEGGDNAFLFTRPRRFGKSLNLSMIRTFFEKTEDDTSVYFRNLKIWECGEKYTSEQGKYPVIYFDLKDINDTTWEEMYEDFKDMIMSEYKRHSELKGRVSENNADKYERIVTGTGTTIDYKSSLRFLTDILYEFHGVKPIILIDEYDTPVQKGYDFGFYDKVIEFIRSFLSRALKGSNLNNTFAVITGAMQIAKEGIYTGLNNLGVYSVMTERYSQYFGFTEDEVIKILDDFGHPEKFDDVCEWYDGYRFGNTKIFNPWSVSKYIDENFNAAAHWVDTSGNSIIRNLLKSPSDVDVKRLRGLMNDVPLYVKIKEKISYGDLYIESEEGSKNSIYSVMLASGYLTVRYDDDGFRYLVIPNTEIKEIYADEILSRLWGATGPDVGDDIKRALLTGNAKLLEDTLQGYLDTSTSYFDLTKEAGFHGFIDGLNASVTSEYRVRSEEESGAGRLDISYEPRNLSKHTHGAVLEIEVAASEKEIEGEVEEAFRQMEDKRYTAKLKDAGVEKVDEYAVVFFGKKVKVVKKETE